jgi:hypothetical protein
MDHRPSIHTRAQRHRIFHCADLLFLPLFVDTQRSAVGRESTSRSTELDCKGKSKATTRLTTAYTEKPGADRSGCIRGRVQEAAPLPALPRTSRDHFAAKLFCTESVANDEIRYYTVGALANTTYSVYVCISTPCHSTPINAPEAINCSNMSARHSYVKSQGGSRASAPKTIITIPITNARS